MRILNFIAMAVFCLAPAFVQAQKSATEDTLHYPLLPVTITATRVSESWLEVPMAVTTLMRADLDHEKGFGAAEVLSGIPGVMAQSRAGTQDTRIVIRGFGARGAGAKSNTGTTRGIRVLVDGFPETEPDGRTSLDLLDFANAGRVDVLRSNSSVVWGNAAGGVVNVISNTDFAAPFVQVSAVSGSYGFMSERLSTGANLGDGRFFLSLTNTSSDGWRVHSGARQTLLNTGIVTPLGSATNLGVYVNATSNLFRIPGPLTQAQFDTRRELGDSSFIKQDDRRYNRIGRIGVSLSHDVSSEQSISASLFASPKFIERSERNAFRDFTRYHVGGNFLYHNRFTLFSGTKDQMIVGVDEAYQDGAIHFYSLTPTGDRGTTLKANKREGAENTGVFLTEEIGVNEQFSFSVGGRYDNIRYFYDDYIDPTVNDRKAFEHVSPKLGVTYKLTSSQSFYANLGGGVEVPAGNEVDPETGVLALNPLLEPITSTTVEVGTKHLLKLGDGAANTLTYDLAAYMINVKNDIIPYEYGNFYFTAGQTRRIGAEFGSKMHMENGFSLGTALTVSNNTYINYTVDSVHYGNPGKFASYEGMKQAGVPQYFYQIDGSFAPAALSGGYVQLRLHGMGEYFADAANTLTIPSYLTMDAVVGVRGYQLSASGLTISAFAGMYNVTDKVYAASAWINPAPAASGAAYLEPGLPRNYAGSVSLGWNF